MLAYLYLYIFSFIISLFKNKRNTYVISAILIFVLTLFAGTRMSDIDNDYALYEYFFSTAVKGNFKNLQTELSVYIIPNVVDWFTDDYIKWTFVIFALLSLGIKIFAIKDFRFFTLAIMLYVGNLFFIQDMTTIRASVASGIFLWSLKDIEESRNKIFFIKLVLAFLFHTSSIVFIIAWLIHKFNVKYKWLILILGFTMLVPVFKLNFIEILHLNVISNKAEGYLKLKEFDEEELNLFNFKILIAFFYLVIFFWKRHKISFPGFDLLLKTHFLSLICFFLFSTTGLTFSLRTFELLSIIQIFLYPLIILCFIPKFKFLGYILVMVTSFIFFYYNIFIADFLKEYSSWLF